jgi:hypothetical protein
MSKLKMLPRKKRRRSKRKKNCNSMTKCSRQIMAATQGQRLFSQPFLANSNSLLRQGKPPRLQSKYHFQNLLGIATSKYKGMPSSLSSRSNPFFLSEALLQKIQKQQ